MSTTVSLVPKLATLQYQLGNACLLELRLACLEAGGFCVSPLAHLNHLDPFAALNELLVFFNKAFFGPSGALSAALHCKSDFKGWKD